MWSRFIQKLGSITFFSDLSISEREKWLIENERDNDIYIDEIEDGVIEVIDLGNSDMNKIR